MPIEEGQSSIAEAARRWVTTGGFSTPVRDALRWDLRVVAQTLADGLDRPSATPEPPAYLRELRRLDWRDLDPLLLTNAITDYGSDHAPASHRRLVATWSSFLEWSRGQGHPLPARGRVRLPPPQPRTDHDPADVGRLVAQTIRSGRRSRDAWPERDRAMVGVIVGGSLSLANGSVLLLRDVQREGDRTWLRSRNRQGKEKVVELPSEVREALDAYLASRQAGAPRRSVPDLFVRAGSGKPYTPEALRYLYVGWFKRAGLAVPRDAPAVALRPIYVEMMREFRGCGSVQPE